MPDLTPFSPERLEAAFKGARGTTAVRQRLELLLERVERMRASGSLAAGDADRLRRRVREAAARWTRGIDSELLEVLLLGAGPDADSPILRRPDLRPAVRSLAAPAFRALLDRVERSAPPERLGLWPVVEALARSASIPPEARTRILDHLHALPGVILAPFPDTSRRMETLRAPEPEDLEPVDLRALEASAVVAALAADPELPPDLLAALVPRALMFSDPLTRIRIAEHPRADRGVWSLFLDAAAPTDRALPGRVAGAWSDPSLAVRLRTLGDSDALPDALRVEVRIRLCGAAPTEVARPWLTDVARHGGLGALALLALDRPDLGAAVSADGCAALLRDRDVRRELGLEGGPGAALTELLEGPGAAFVRRLLRADAD